MCLRNSFLTLRKVTVNIHVLCSYMMHHHRSWYAAAWTLSTVSVCVCVCFAATEEFTRSKS